MSNEKTLSYGHDNWRDAYLAKNAEAKELKEKLAAREKELVDYAKEATATENSLRASLRHTNAELVRLKREQEERLTPPANFFTAPEVGIHEEGFLPNRGRANESVCTLKVPGGWIYEFYSRKSFPHSDKASKTKLRAAVFVPEPQPGSEELEEARRELAEMRSNYENACVTIAKMHEAAVGEVRGPIYGVVKDVSTLRQKMLRLNMERNQYIQACNNREEDIKKLNDEIKKLREAKEDLEKLVWALRNEGK